MPTTNLTAFERQTKAFEYLVCSLSSAGGLQQLSIYFTAVHILLSLMAFLGNFLILVALLKVSSLHPPSKVLYSCFATTDLLVSIVSQPFIANLLDVLGPRRVVSLSTRIQSSVHHNLCIMFGVFVDNGGHKRGQTSRPFVGAKIQANCNFKAHLLHGSNLLGTVCRGCLILYFRLPNWYVVQPYNYTILPNILSGLVHKDILRSQSSPGSSTRFNTTTTEPTKCTKHGAIQKGSVWCSMGAVSISWLLRANRHIGNCDCI